ncbi:MAG TPA: HAD family hydrolase [Moraxellaceae bacterium]
MIKLLTFDLDNTLWDVDSIVLRADKAMRDWIRDQHADFAAGFDFRAMRALRDEVMVQRPDIHHDLTQLRTEVLRRAFLAGGYGEAEALVAAQGAFDAFFRERNRVEFFPDVLEGLATLRRDYEMYSISNGNADIQRVGLGHVFSRHFSAISVGAAKPDPRIYQAALDAAGVTPQEVLHVGDDPEQDVQAAAALGMHTVWVNYGDKVWPEPLPPATAQISRFAELLPLVQQLQRQLDGR